MKWILQKNLISKQQVDEVIDIFQNNEIPFEAVDVIPFSDTIEIKSNDPFKIPYGSTSLSNFAYKNNWKGIFFNENFKTSVWIKNRNDLLNSDCRIFTVEEARNVMLTEDAREWFVRPDNDLKEFAGARMFTCEFNEWMDNMSGANGNLLHEKTSIVVAPVKKISAEWRWFIVNGKIIDGSIYRLRGVLHKQHEDDPDVYAEVQELVDIWLPHETCVMDTALVEDQLKVIEFNCLNCSGFYDHDIEKIILAITMSINIIEYNKHN